MRDPIEELESFTSPGLTMDPIPASEVRRRGTHMRRRNTALATVGGIAAVVVIATPIAVLASGHTSKADVDPAPPAPHSWTQTIPADFRLADGMPDGSTQSDASAMDPITTCGNVAWSAEGSPRPVDVAGASYADANSEGAQTRTLALYADDTAAADALTQLRDFVVGCPTDSNGSGATLVNDVVEVAPGGDGLFLFTNQAKDGDLLYDLTAYEVVRSGNALYVASSFSSAGGSQNIGALDLLDNRSQPVTDQLCQFSADGCGPVGVPDRAAIADGFPLLDGLPTETATADFGRFGPDQSRAPLKLVGCGGRTLPTPEHSDWLVGGWSDPAEQRMRQLVTFPTDEKAEAYASAISQLLTCPAEPQGSGSEKVRTAREGGDNSMVYVTSYTQDGEPAAAGFQVTQYVQVGNAVLVSDRINDGEPIKVTDVVLDDLVDDSTQRLAGVIDAMAPYAG